MEEGFASFDTMEEMVEFMRRQEEEANAHLAPQQQAVTWGDYWIRFYDIEHRICIFGHVYTEDEMMEKERAVPLMAGESSEEVEAEIAAEMEGIRDAHKRGYMYGWAYSVIEPEGEPGSTHQANLWPIPQWLYEQARDVRWVMDDLDPQGKAEVQRAYTEYRTHMLSLER